MMVISDILVWKNGIQRRTTLYFVATVAGEQTQILRLSAHPVKSIIV
jgi:hypothetical protein